MHPRLKYYPHHADYLNQANEFRPYVTAISEPNYRSRSLNTDEFGFRVQYLPDGERINFRTFKANVQECNLLLGNSTSFGVTASSDRHTLSSFLADRQAPWVNWGVRGATAQQELFLYLSFKYLLPPQRNIVLLAGVNEASLAVTDGGIAFPELGGVFGEGLFFRQFMKQYSEYADRGSDGYASERLHDAVERLFIRSPWVRSIVRCACGILPNLNRESNPRAPAERIETVLGHLDNALESWSWIQRASGAKVHYILQPVIGWTEKPLTEIERYCFEDVLTRVDSVKAYTQRELYLTMRAEISHMCSSRGIDFYDANEWLNGTEYAESNLFTDTCHFNDEGNALLARLVRRYISLQ